ncbi:MAG: RNase adapter RapZ, partial [Actinobacteria bacterium]|nr:RNase adapter RapZ [Actinomycetota bacterium]
ALIESLIKLLQPTMKKIAVIIDVRGGEFFDSFSKSVEQLKKSGVSSQTIFIDAADDVLVRRFEATRRPHPLQGSSRILDGILRERERLREVKESADLIIDSSTLNIHQLERKIADHFNDSTEADLRVNILSFGYKYGIPVDADLVMDCRFIANPHWDPELRPLNGLNEKVSKAVLESNNVQEFLTRYERLFETIAVGFIAEGRKYLTLAIGCTGGKHRSVAITEELIARLQNGKTLGNYTINAHAIHRDLGRES